MLVSKTHNNKSETILNSTQKWKHPHRLTNAKKCLKKKNQRKMALGHLFLLLQFIYFTIIILLTNIKYFFQSKT